MVFSNVNIKISKLETFFFAILVQIFNKMSLKNIIFNLFIIFGNIMTSFHTIDHLTYLNEHFHV